MPKSTKKMKPVMTHGSMAGTMVLRVKSCHTYNFKMAKKMIEYKAIPLRGIKCMSAF